MEHERLGAGRVRVTLRPRPEVSERYTIPAAACWNFQGVLEGIPTIWDLPDATVRRVHCCHLDSGSDHCVYEVTFDENTLADPLALAGTCLFPAAARRVAV